VVLRISWTRGLNFGSFVGSVKKVNTSSMGQSITADPLRHVASQGAVDDWLRRAHAEWSDRIDRPETHLVAQTQSTIAEENPHA
jgi:hypothetical protein